LDIRLYFFFSHHFIDIYLYVFLLFIYVMRLVLYLS
jgi:hypothetical protein